MRCSLTYYRAARALVLCCCVGSVLYTGSSSGVALRKVTSTLVEELQTSETTASVLTGIKGDDDLVVVYLGAS